MIFVITIIHFNIKSRTNKYVYNSFANENYIGNSDIISDSDYIGGFEDRNIGGIRLYLSNMSTYEITNNTCGIMVIINKLCQTEITTDSNIIYFIYIYDGEIKLDNIVMAH